jgi:Fe-S-cluster containining protein
VSELLPVDHHRFRRVERAIFVRRVVADCMGHACALRKEGDRVKLDACCSYGADVDVGERDAILARRAQIAAILVPAARAAPWFVGAERVDADFPSGRHVRSATLGDGCLFLAHDGRGCAIHRAALEGGWSIDGVKPNICRLFPMTYAGSDLVVSDDYADYSCADAPGAPTIYRVSRDALAAVFDPALVVALDALEARVAAEASAARPAALQVVG